MAGPAMSAGGSAGAMAVADIDYGDIQGLVRFGHGHLSEASYYLLAITDPDAARTWLRGAPVTTAVTTDPPPDVAMQVAFTRQGLGRLGLADHVVAAFSDEFIGGMARTDGHARRLGDVGANAPAGWDWGGTPDDTPHLLVMLFARPDGLAAWEAAVQDGLWHTAFHVRRRLDSHDMGEIEPFGFADGLSQPRLDWRRELDVDTHRRAGYANLLALGEVLLGYPNEYGQYTQRPLLDPAESAAADLPPAEDEPAKRDLGRNGSYLVFRQLHQDVRGFWQFLDRQAGGRAEERERLGAAMVGRTRAGIPLMPPVEQSIVGTGPVPADIAANRFTYDADPEGVRCPLGAHIRRSNPRTGDLPAGVTGLLSRLLRVLGFVRPSIRTDTVASTRFHRLLRRGREYGVHVEPEDALRPGPANEPATGLHFICLVANIARQFEFVQNAWTVSSKFSGLSGETDPLLGNRKPLPHGESTDGFTIPHEDGPPRCITDLPQFVTVRGGAYFFLPGIRALRYIAGAP